MNLDSNTLVVAAAGCMAVVSVVFSSVTALRLNDHAGRLWSVMFAAMTVSLGATGAAGFTDPAPIGWEAVAAGTASLTVGLLWSGFRAFDGRPAYVAVVLLIASVVTLLAAVGAAQTDQNAAQLISQLAILAQGILVIVTISRSSLTGDLNVLILQVTVMAVVAVAVANAAAAAGSVELVDTALLDSLYAPLGVVAAISLSSARIEHRGISRVLGMGREHHEVLPMMASEAFNEVVDDRFERLKVTGGHAVLIAIELRDLAEINTAFGRRTGNRALLALAEVIRRTAPAWAVLGHAGAGRFWVFAPAASRSCADELQDVFRAALGEEQAPLLHVPLLAATGSSDTYRSTMDRRILQEDAAQDLEQKLRQR